MRAKIGDVVIDKTYNKRGNLAIVVGEGISQPILIGHRGGITMDKLRDYFAVWDGLEVIGHIDFEKIWEEALRINEPNCSEKPNNCETCKHDSKEWYEDPCGWCCGAHSGYEPKTEPQTEVETMSCEECKHWTFTSQWGWFCPLKGQDKCHYEPIEDEPQTDIHDLTDCDFCKDRNCKDCEGGKEEPQTDDLIKQADSLIEFEKELLKTEPQNERSSE